MEEERRHVIVSTLLAVFALCSFMSLSAAFAIVAYGFSPWTLFAADLHPAAADLIPESWQDRNIRPGSAAYGHAMIAAVVSTTLFVTLASTQVHAYAGQPFFVKRRFVFFTGSASLVVAAHAAFGNGGPLELARRLRDAIFNAQFESSVATWVVVGLAATGMVVAFSRAQARADEGLLLRRWALRDATFFNGESRRRMVHLKQTSGPSRSSASLRGGYLHVEEPAENGQWWSRGRRHQDASPVETGALVGELIDTAPTLIEQAMDQRTADMVRRGQAAVAGVRGPLVSEGQLAVAPPVPWWVAFGRHARRMTTPTRCPH